MSVTAHGTLMALVLTFFIMGLGYTRAQQSLGSISFVVRVVLTTG